MPPHHMRGVLVLTDSLSNATKWLTLSSVSTTRDTQTETTTILFYFVQIFKTFCNFFANQQFGNNVVLSLILPNCYGYSVQTPPVQP